MQISLAEFAGQVTPPMESVPAGGGDGGGTSQVIILPLQSVFIYPPNSWFDGLLHLV